MYKCRSTANEIRTFASYDEAHRFVMREGDQSRLWTLDPATRKLHFVFTDFPGPGNECVFVECETDDGRSVNAGEWRRRGDGLAEIVIDQAI